MPSSLNRRKTCPITRRESEQLMEVFLHMPVSSTVKKTINDNINNNNQNDKDYSEKERPHLLQRSDSYRRATQRFSPQNDPDEVSTFKKENYDPQKYRSLPIDTKLIVRNNKGSPTSILDKRNKLKRQQSGTVPSSDSDNPISSSENRKKKSVFQRTKERIIFKLRKDKKRGEDRNKKSNENKQEIQRTLKSHQYESVSGVESRKSQRNSAPINEEIVKPKVDTTKSTSPDSYTKLKGVQNSPSSNMAPSTRSPQHGRQYRSQVSREEITNMFEKILSSAEIREEPFKFPNDGQDLKGSFKRKHCSPVRDTSYADGIKNKKHGLTLNIVPFMPNFTSEGHVLVTEDSTETSTDKEGARHTVHKHSTYERTFSLEIDGVDEIDGSPSKAEKDAPHEGTKAEGAHEDPLSPTEQERMIEEIAKRLNRIADECVQRMGTGEPQTTRGAVAEPLLSPNSRSRKLANDLVLELRKEGDRLSRELNLPDNLLPIVMAMVKQITYDHFKDLVKKALCQTIGWDQVAMYFYVSRAAIVMAGVGGQLACQLKTMVVRYFHEEISPWIYDRGGLETMLDETDSEVD